jgi:hypothetical protein
MRVRLIRKLADRIDGVDVSAYEVGDVIDLSAREAKLLLAEQWAVRSPEVPTRETRHRSTAVEAAVAADAPGRQSAVKQLQRVSDQLDSGRFEEHRSRRTEDRVLQELQDASGRNIDGDQD